MSQRTNELNANIQDQQDAVDMDELMQQSRSQTRFDEDVLRAPLIDDRANRRSMVVVRRKINPQTTRNEPYTGFNFGMQADGEDDYYSQSGNSTNNVLAGGGGGNDEAEKLDDKMVMD